MPLTRQQKEIVVEALMYQAGNIAEYWEDVHEGLRVVPMDEGIEYLASLMRKMPGKSWDQRLK